MDQKLLDALNNLSEALEQISEALKDKKGNKSPTAEALQGGKFINQIKEINIGVRQLQKDSKQILKNQETIIQLSKNSSSDKKSEFEKAGGDKKQESNIKKGVGTILLIAVAVLAIGMAFKLVGGINFLSVIGLSLGILIMAKAFEKVAMLNLSIKQAAIVSASLVIMAFGLTAASWIMKMITPISIAQSFTAILIGIGFSVLSPAIAKIINAFKGMGWGALIKAVVFLPFVLPAIAIGITLSSWALRHVSPISFGQAITAILISGLFTVISFGIRKMLSAFGSGFGTLIKAVIFLPLVLPAIALGIAASSWHLKKVTPISFGQAITSILIGAVFAVIGFGLKKLLGAFGGNSIIGIAAAILFLPSVMEAVADGIVRASGYLKKTQNVGWNQALSAILIAVIFTVISFGLKKLVDAVSSLKNPLAIVLVPILLPAMAYAIQLSSKTLSKVTLMTMDQFWTSLGIAALFVVFALALKIIGPNIDRINMGAVVKMPLMFTALSVAIWASSKILAKATVMEDEFLKQLLKFSIVAAIAMAVMGGVSFLLNKIGFTNILKGSLAIPVIAAVIMASSLILSLGVYKEGSYPSLDWALGVGLSLAGFAAGAGILGLLVFGPQALVFAAGLGAILVVAGTIVATSHILAKGNYKQGPGLAWSLSTSLLMQTFGTLVGILGIMPKSWVKDGTEAVKAIANSIVHSAWIFHYAKAAFVGGPTKAWADGVGTAISAFSPVYAMLMANGVAKLFGGGGVGPEEFSLAIKTVSKGIIDSANVFAKSPAVWTGGPTFEWADGVGTAISAFAPVYSMLLANGVAKLFGGGGIGPEEFSAAIVTVSSGIIQAAKVFASPDNKSVWINGPTSEWAEGVGIALGAFAPVYKMLMANGVAKLFGGGGVGPADFATAIVTVSNGIIQAAGIFAINTAKFEEGKYPSENWGKGVGAALNAFAPVFNSLSKDTGWFTSGDEVISNMVNGVIRIASAIVSVAKLFGSPKIDWTKYPSALWASNVRTTLLLYTNLANTINAMKLDLMAMFKLEMVVRKLTMTARLFGAKDINWKARPDPLWSSKVQTTVILYAALARSVNNMKVDMVALNRLEMIAKKLVVTARIFSMNEKLFNAKINPNFMKSVSHNLFYYMEVAKAIQSKQGGLTGFLNRAIMGDPVVRMAEGMALLAKAYDKLAASITKMGTAMRSLDDKKIAQMERMSRIVVPKREMSGIGGFIGDAIGSAVKSAANIVTPNVMAPTNSASAKRSADRNLPPKGKYGEVTKQNDMIIDLLIQLNGAMGPESTLNIFLIKKLQEGESSMYH